MCTKFACIKYLLSTCFIDLRGLKSVFCTNIKVLNKLFVFVYSENLLCIFNTELLFSKVCNGYAV